MDRNNVNMDTLSGAMQHLASVPTSVAIVLVVDPCDDGQVEFHTFVPDGMAEADVPRWLHLAWESYHEDDGDGDDKDCRGCSVMGKMFDQAQHDLLRAQHIKLKDDRTIGALNEARQALIDDVAALRKELAELRAKNTTGPEPT